MKKLHVIALFFLAIATTNSAIQPRFAQSLFDMEQNMMSMMEELDSLFNAPLQTRNDAASGLSIKETAHDVVLHISPLEMTAEAVKAERTDDTLEISVQQPHLKLELAITQNHVKYRLEQERVQEKENDKGEVISKQAYSNTQSFMQSLPAEVTIQDVAIEYNDTKKALTVSLPRLTKKTTSTAIPVSIKK